MLENIGGLVKTACKVIWDNKGKVSAGLGLLLGGIGIGRHIGNKEGRNEERKERLKDKKKADEAIKKQGERIDELEDIIEKNIDDKEQYDK